MKHLLAFENFQAPVEDIHYLAKQFNFLPCSLETLQKAKFGTDDVVCAYSKKHVEGVWYLIQGKAYFNLYYFVKTSTRSFKYFGIWNNFEDMLNVLLHAEEIINKIRPHLQTYLQSDRSDKYYFMFELIDIFQEYNGECAVD